MSVKKELLEILACPKCKGHLKHDKKASSLDCMKCRLRYNIVDDIPDMIIEDARKF